MPHTDGVVIPKWMANALVMTALGVLVSIGSGLFFGAMAFTRVDERLKVLTETVSDMRIESRSSQSEILVRVLENADRLQEHDRRLTIMETRMKDSSDG